ncbi:carbohydrate ABC transporter permease [Kribbella sp. NPDC048928]|uniref:carbohydrate ABC transporter permease n=1 Tax=Kribbella sp. NPDC048928 TaxID=3364111 RepID=UPI00371B2E8A
MIAPMGVGVAVLYLWPILQTFYFSFTAWGPFGGSTWTGLTNYTQLLHDPAVWTALRNTIAYMFLTLLGVPPAMVFAALLNRRGLRGRGMFRTLYYLPVVTMPAAIGLLWQYLYNGDYGLINQGLGRVGISGPGWLTDPHTALVALALVGIWSQFGYNLVLFMAGLQNVPRELYEAAALDGAGSVRQFLRVTVPMLSPTTFFVSVISAIGSLQMFDLVYLMIPPASPAAGATRTVVSLFYETAFVKSNPGYGAAIAFMLLLFIAALTGLQFRLQRRWVHYA